MLQFAQMIDLFLPIYILERGFRVGAGVIQFDCSSRNLGEGDSRFFD